MTEITPLEEHTLLILLRRYEQLGLVAHCIKHFLVMSQKNYETNEVLLSQNRKLHESPVLSKYSSLPNYKGSLMWCDHEQILLSYSIQRECAYLFSFGTDSKFTEHDYEELGKTKLSPGAVCLGLFTCKNNAMIGACVVLKFGTSPGQEHEFSQGKLLL